MSNTWVKPVDMRHWIFSCAITLGASTMPATAAAIRPLAVAMNRRRSVVTRSLRSCRHEPVVSTLRHLIPGTKERLEPRVGGVDLLGHGALLGFLSGHLRRELSEIAQHRRRKRKHLDLGLELGLELLQRHRVPGMELGEA